MKTNNKMKEFVLKKVHDNNVKFIRLLFTDVQGILKSFSITREELERALQEGMGFDGSSIEGFSRIEESDVIALPDPNTFQMLPWSPPENGVARMFCDVLNPDGSHFEGDPRWVLKKELKKIGESGYTYYIGPELEYFYFKSDKGKPETLDRGGYFDLTTLDAASPLRRDTILCLESMGIGVEYSHHEVAPSQHEIDLRYTDALTMADNAMTYRMIAKEMVAITNQWVNSYKRLVPGYEAPVYISWARRNRSTLVRVPMYKPGKEKATRMEFRSPDPACNPYLTFAVMLAAGLKGIEKGYELPPPVEEDIFEMSEEARKKHGIDSLPGRLYEAVQLTEQSELVRETLGDHIFQKFIENKKIEWDQYRTHVSQFELEKYLPIL